MNETFNILKFSFDLSLCLSLFGCYNIIPQTGWLINDSNSFLTVLEAESLRSECPHGVVRALFGVVDFSLCPHMVEGERELSGVNPIHGGSTLLT